jgi:SAM-dependent methyltransferase/predicted O-methyltransferase YrrM
VSALPVSLPASLPAEERAQRERRAAELGPWLHGPFPLGGGLEVRGAWRTDERWDVVAPLVGDVSGLRALDVGANAGFDAFMLKLLGARDVLACEPFGAFAQAQFLESIYGTGIDLRQIGWQALDVHRHGLFDLVHCGNLLFHEPDPLRLLLRLRELTLDSGRLILGTMIDPDLAAPDLVRFVSGEHAGDPTWWWVPGAQALRGMLGAAGWEIVDERRYAAGPDTGFRSEYRFFAASPRSPAPALVTAEGMRASEVANRSPLGHYYSPLPDQTELASSPRRSQIWPPVPRETPGIDWRDADQLRLVRDVFARQPQLQLLDDESDDPTEYFALNDQYPFLDARLLEAMLNHLRPRRVIEVGSGFSSLITARVNREHFGGGIDFTCIEPYPRQFLLDGVPGISGLRVEKIQDTPLAVFEALGDGDILFIDTSHTVKTGGDVVWLYEEVVPRLAPGVAVHIHDVFLPGDYPEPWVMEGWGWNEVYLVHAFLAFNAAFDVAVGAQYMLHRHLDALVAAFPGLEAQLGRGGAALWLRRKSGR